MVQVPTARNVAVVPETVQTVVVSEANLTGKPELADAFRMCDPPTTWLATALNVIVCGCPTTGKVCETGVAAR